MKQPLTRYLHRPHLRTGAVAAVALVAAVMVSPIGANAAPTPAPTSGTVLQTNLVSDLPGVAATTDPNLVNAWGISESGMSPFWISDNGSSLSTLYQVPGANNAAVSTVPLVVNIPTPMALTGGTPTGTVFNTSLGSGAFRITGPNNAGQMTTMPSVFLFATEDGTIVGWNPAIDPTGRFAGPNGLSTQAVVAIDNSGAGAVYKGLAVTSGTTPIVPADPASTALLYATNFRAGTIAVYDANLAKVLALPAGAFTDPALPAGYAPFNVEVLGGKVYVTYALQDADKKDDVAGEGHGFVDVFNLDGTPGLPAGTVRLISRGPLNSPWGLAIAPQGFAGLTATGGDAVLLVGNFGDGFVNAFDATTGASVGRLSDPDGEPIQIDGLWALKVGNGAAGGAADTIYFTAGPFDESHGLFGSLSTAAPGSPEGPAEAQWVRANVDVVQLDLQQLSADIRNHAPLATIRQDIQTLLADFRALVQVQRAFAADAVDDAH